jgi:hypothetical protein
MPFDGRYGLPQITRLVTRVPNLNTVITDPSANPKRQWPGTGAEAERPPQATQIKAWWAALFAFGPRAGIMSATLVSAISWVAWSSP